MDFYTLLDSNYAAKHLLILCKKMRVFYCPDNA